jgi:type I restriction enzyme R subunit
MPPVSRFAGGNRAAKKQAVIDKLKSFFDKFYGIGGSFASYSNKIVNYTDMVSDTQGPIAAEDTEPY